MTHKVLISDKLAPEGVSILAETEQLEVDLRPGMKPEQLRAAVADYEALIIRSGTKVTSEIDRCGDFAEGYWPRRYRCRQRRC